MADWSGLPEEIIDLFSKLTWRYAEEFARFNSVCKSFSSVGSGRYREHRSPWLLIPKARSEDEDGNNNNKNSGAEELESSTSIRAFFSLSSNRLFHIELPHSRGQGHRCWGSPYGWLVSVGRDRNIHIFNPLTRSKLSLPPYHSFDFNAASLNNENENADANDADAGSDEDADADADYEADYDANHDDLLFAFSVFKLVLASNPSFWTTERRSDQCCMAIYGEFDQLAFAFPGDQAWTTLESPLNNYTDVIFFHGHFYAVNRTGNLWRCDIDTTNPRVIDIASSPNGNLTSSKYLVEMSGDLYMVQRTIRIKYKEGNLLGDSFYETTAFEVFKFDPNDSMWTPVSHLGDHALFLGVNTSFSILAYNYPEFKANCIYFTQDEIDTYDNSEHWDMGVYHYLNKSVEPFYSGQHVFSNLTRPALFLPNL